MGLRRRIILRMFIPSNPNPKGKEHYVEGAKKKVKTKMLT